jgi:hypothetical protein
VKDQNGGCVQDGIKNIYIFHSIFLKMIFLVNFSFFLFTLDKNITFIEKLFS